MNSQRRCASWLPPGGSQGVQTFSLYALLQLVWKIFYSLFSKVIFCVDIRERMCYNWVIKNQPNRGGTTTIRRPGVMVYFGTIRPCLKLLNKTEQLQLFDAILDYAEFGDVPDFGGTLGTVWSILQVQLDRDFEAYARKVRRRKAAYDPDSYEE